KEQGLLDVPFVDALVRLEDQPGRVLMKKDLGDDGAVEEGQVWSHWGIALWGPHDAHRTLPRATAARAARTESDHHSDTERAGEMFQRSRVSSGASASS